MNINIASKNPIKIRAVEEVIKDYDFLSKAKINSTESSSEVSKEPKSLEETVSGAMNRARNSFKTCDYSFGIESGLMQVPYTKTGEMDVCVCAIYDGRNYHLGLSCAFEFPPKVIELIHTKGLDANEAFFKCRLTDKEKIGAEEGAIGLLTKGKVTRKDYTKQAIKMALIQLENKDLYQPNQS